MLLPPPSGPPPIKTGRNSTLDTQAAAQALDAAGFMATTGVSSHEILSGGAACSPGACGTIVACMFRPDLRCSGGRQRHISAVLQSVFCTMQIARRRCNAAQQRQRATALQVGHVLQALAASASVQKPSSHPHGLRRSCCVRNSMMRLQKHADRVT